MPKGVVLTRQAVEHNARAVASLHGFGPGRPHATCLPLYHCNALMMSLLGSLLAALVFLALVQAWAIGVDFLFGDGFRPEGFVNIAFGVLFLILAGSKREPLHLAGTTLAWVVTLVGLGVRTFQMGT